jgi:hypothetical protein
MRPLERILDVSFPCMLAGTHPTSHVTHPHAPRLHPTPRPPAGVLGPCYYGAAGAYLATNGSAWAGSRGRRIRLERVASSGHPDCKVLPRCRRRCMGGTRVHAQRHVLMRERPPTLAPVTDGAMRELAAACCRATRDGTQCTVGRPAIAAASLRAWAFDGQHPRPEQCQTGTQQCMMWSAIALRTSTTFGKGCPAAGKYAAPQTFLPHSWFTPSRSVKPVNMSLCAARGAAGLTRAQTYPGHVIQRSIALGACS